MKVDVQTPKYYWPRNTIFQFSVRKIKISSDLLKKFYKMIGKNLEFSSEWKSHNKWAPTGNSIVNVYYFLTHYDGKHFISAENSRNSRKRKKSE